MELVAQDIEDGHAREDFRGCQLFLHDERIYRVGDKHGDCRNGEAEFEV